ncbi:hypothetical protein J4465_01980 [Candidatus Pacearchaeota archaeon]|nr:hypothetical protein [Candidatus Pacearchaeota archaeon]
MVILDNGVELKNFLDIIYQTLKAIKSKDLALLRELSNRTIHGASISKDTDSVSIAVIVYSLSKIIGRLDYYEEKQFITFMSGVTKNLESGAIFLKQKNFSKFRSSIKNITSSIDNLSGKLKLYIQDIFREAKINKASRLYEHGISREETANLLGISLWELSEYVGKTGISDVDLSITKPIKERINNTRELFE